jgi:hypothetical protein
MVEGPSRGIEARSSEGPDDEIPNRVPHSFPGNAPTGRGRAISLWRILFGSAGSIAYNRGRMH